MDFHFGKVGWVGLAWVLRSILVVVLVVLRGGLSFGSGVFYERNFVARRGSMRFEGQASMIIFKKSFAHVFRD